MGAFVTIHGIDGTGKTTVAQMIPQAFQNAFSSAYYFDDLLIPEVVLTPGMAETKYQESVIKKIGQSGMVQGVLDGGALVSKDRWMIDVAASNSYSDHENYTTNPNGVLVPQLSVLLTCDEDERMRRVHARGNPTADDLIPKEPGTRAHYFESFLREHLGAFAVSALILDTTHMPPATVIEEIKGALLHDARV